MVSDPLVLDAIRSVPRDQFVPEHTKDYAFDDVALPIGHGQTVSQPTIVGIMVQALKLTGTERVLEIGTGSGYQAAVLARLAASVVTVEVVPELRDSATELLVDLGFHNVNVLDPRGTLGVPESAPFDRIVVAAACPSVPASLIDQLAEGGILVAPVGRRYEQELVVARKTGAGLQEHRLGRCRFVPLVGDEGFEPYPIP